MLSRNPNAIRILENNFHRIDWTSLSTNPNAIHILEDNLEEEKISWTRLSRNPGLFIETYDTKKIPESPHKDLVAMIAYRPERIVKYRNMGYDISKL